MRHLSCSGSPTGMLSPVNLITPAAASYPVSRVCPFNRTCGRGAASRIVLGAVFGTPRMWIASTTSCPCAAPAFDRTTLVITPESPDSEATAVYHTCAGHTHAEQTRSTGRRQTRWHISHMHALNTGRVPPACLPACAVAQRRPQALRTSGCFIAPVLPFTSSPNLGMPRTAPGTAAQQ